MRDFWWIFGMLAPLYLLIVVTNWRIGVLKDLMDAKSALMADELRDLWEALRDRP